MIRRYYDDPDYDDELAWRRDETERIDIENHLHPETWRTKNDRNPCRVYVSRARDRGEPAAAGSGEGTAPHPACGGGLPVFVDPLAPVVKVLCSALVGDIL